MVSNLKITLTGSFRLLKSDPFGFHKTIVVIQIGNESKITRERERERERERDYISKILQNCVCEVYIFIHTCI